MHDLQALELQFSFEDHRELNIVGEFPDLAEKRCFITALRRNPKHLKHHVQRINFSLKLSDPEEVYCALLDLFIVLGKNGLDLRKRMLILSRSQLSDEDMSFFKKHLCQGIEENTISRVCFGSIFTSSYIGNPVFIEKNIAQSGGGHCESLYDEAILALEYGNLDEAKKLLWESIEQDPTGKEPPTLLLEIYNGEEDQQAICRTVQWYKNRGIKLPEAWSDFEVKRMA